MPKTGDGANQGESPNGRAIPSPEDVKSVTGQLREPAEQDSSRWVVILERPGIFKDEVITTVRDISGLGLKEAKDLVERAPAVVRAHLCWDNANMLKTLLEEEGAFVKLTRMPDRDASKTVEMTNGKILTVPIRKDWVQAHEDGETEVQHSSALLYRIREYLSGINSNYVFIGQSGHLIAQREISGKLHSVELKVYVTQKEFIVHGYVPLHINAESASRVAEYLEKANFGLKHGCFEWQGSVVRFRSSLYCGDDLPSLDVVERIVDLPLEMWTRYGDGYVKVLFGIGSPSEEIEKVEFTG